jgi:hypothetical protein
MLSFAVLISALVLEDNSAVALSLPKDTTTLSIITLSIATVNISTVKQSVIIPSVVVPLGKDKAATE